MSAQLLYQLYRRSPSISWCKGLFLPRCRALLFPVVTCLRFLVSPFLQPVKVPLLGSTTLRRRSLSSQLCATCKLSEGTLCPIIRVTEWEQDLQSAAQGLADMPFARKAVTCHRRFRNLGGKATFFLLCYIECFPSFFLQAMRSFFKLSHVSCERHISS